MNDKKKMRHTLILIFTLSSSLLFSQNNLETEPAEIDNSITEQKRILINKIKDLNNEILIYPNEISLRFKKINSLFKLNDYLNAKNEIVSLLQKNKKQSWDLNKNSIKKKALNKILIDSILSYRKTFLNDKNYSKCVENINFVMDYAINSFKKSAEIYLYASLSRKNIDEQLYFLLKSHKYDSKKIDTIYELAKLYMRKNDNKEALKYFNLAKENTKEKYLTQLINENITELNKRITTANNVYKK